MRSFEVRSWDKQTQTLEEEIKKLTRKKNNEFKIEYQIREDIQLLKTNLAQLNERLQSILAPKKEEHLFSYKERTILFWGREITKKMMNLLKKSFDFLNQFMWCKLVQTRNLGRVQNHEDMIDFDMFSPQIAFDALQTKTLENSLIKRKHFLLEEKKRCKEIYLQLSVVKMNTDSTHIMNIVEFPKTPRTDLAELLQMKLRLLTARIGLKKQPKLTEIQRNY